MSAHAKRLLSRSGTALMLTAVPIWVASFGLHVRSDGGGDTLELVGLAAFLAGAVLWEVASPESSRLRPLWHRESSRAARVGAGLWLLAMLFLVVAFFADGHGWTALGLATLMIAERLERPPADASADARSPGLLARVADEWRRPPAAQPVPQHDAH